MNVAGRRGCHMRFTTLALANELIEAVRPLQRVVGALGAL